MKLSSRIGHLASVIGVATICALATGCGRSENAATGSESRPLRIAVLGEPNDLDPTIVDTMDTAEIVSGLIEGLVQYDPKTSMPIPAVAERWEHNPDSTIWTFHLRPDARWSNGDPVTSADFAYSFRRMLSAGLGAEYSSMLFVIKNGELYHGGKITDFSQVGVRTPNPRTLVLELEHPVAYLDKMVCHHAWYPVHQATIEKFGKMDQRGSQWTRPGNYVGNGPFVLVEWKPNQIIRMTRSATYWDRANIRLSEVNFFPMDSESTQEAAFRTGRLDVTSVLNPDKIATYKNDPKMRESLHQETNLATYMFRLNIEKPPLNDVRVRRALSMAVDRKLMVERVTLGGQPPAFSFTPPNIGGFTANPNFKYDPEAARKLLAEAGFPGGAGFPRLEYLYNTSEGHRKIAEALQQMWKRELGIEISLSNQEGKVWNDLMRTTNYQIARYAWVGDYIEATTFLDMMRSNDGNNQTNWKSAEYDRLIAQAARTADEAARFALYQRCEAILAEEVPVIPLYFYVRNNLWTTKLKGWYGNPLDRHPFTGVYLEP